VSVAQGIWNFWKVGTRCCSWRNQ